MQAGVCRGLTGSGAEIAAGRVVLTTGTFLRGLIYLGETRIRPAVRAASAPACRPTLRPMRLKSRLRESRRRCNVWASCWGGLKTGTPPRLDGRTIDYAGLERQQGDDPPVPFSYLTDTITAAQVACHVTATKAATHELIRANLHRAPMYSGQIESVGPRYCPSIEDKVVRFGHRDRHQIFLEPEGLDDPTVYPNGISTSLPRDVQGRCCRPSPVWSGQSCSGRVRNRI